MPAYTALTINEISRAGIAATLVSADETDGHSFVNDGRTFIHAINTADAGNITFLIPRTVAGQSVTDREEVLPVNAVGEFFGPFPPGDYNQADGTVYITISEQDNVTLGAFRLPG